MAIGFCPFCSSFHTYALLEMANVYAYKRVIVILTSLEASAIS
ncbi:hypothetical protein CCACVL1_16195 [Corchorus capsularis]|uniref:Uncharacterized protein n=2 Tax=Corchorus TaxID=93758 RepID=A0A1R3HYC9_COCAP|nr:hypothetical protein CCACVL1_16195 [Corchorus capsularis]OMO92126.1 hypothetical protein COLO4_17866 [Corchorus olitorius]